MFVNHSLFPLGISKSLTNIYRFTIGRVSGVKCIFFVGLENVVFGTGKHGKCV